MFRMAIIAISFVTLLWWFIADRMLARHLPGRRWPRVLLALFAVAHYGYIAFRIIGRMADWTATPPLFAEISGYVWNLVIIPCVVVPMLLLLAVVGLLRLARWISRAITGEEPTLIEPVLEPAAESRLSRRQFIGLTVAAAPPLLTLTGTAVAIPQLGALRVRQLEAPIAGLPVALDGLKIAHLTDIHVGKFTGEGVLSKMIERTLAQSPDLILVTGDIIDSSHDDIPEAVAALERLHAPHGVFLCEGNHDLFGGVDEFREAVRKSGLRLLLNEWERIPVGALRLDVGGIAWGRPGQRRGVDMEGNMDRLLALRPDGGDASLLLAHHPHAFDLAADAGIGATFSGHTHGGQLMLSDGIGAGPMMFKYWSGVYRRDGRALVVSNGVGNWMPLRINAPAEVVMVTLRGA